MADAAGRPLLVFMGNSLSAQKKGIINVAIFVPLSKERPSGQTDLDLAQRSFRLSFSEDNRGLKHQADLFPS